MMALISLDDRNVSKRVVSLLGVRLCPSDIRFLVAASFIILTLVELPYLKAWLFPPEGYVFQGSLLWEWDQSQYLGTMREASSTSSWLVHDHLTPESHSPAFFAPFYILLGKLAGVMPIPIGLFYHAAGIGAQLVFLVSAYVLVCAFVSERRWRMIGLFVVMFGSGLKFLTYSVSVGMQIPVPHLLMPEVDGTLRLLLQPHRQIGLAAVLLSFVATGDYLKSMRTASLLWLAVLAALGSLADPFSAIALVGALWVGTLAHGVWRKLAFPFVLIPATVVTISCLPVLIYYGLVFAQDPFWGTLYVGQNTQEFPSVLTFVANGDFIFLGGVVGISSLVLRRDPMGQLLVGFTVALLILAYLPLTQLTLRLSTGLYPLLAVGFTRAMQAVMESAVLVSRTVKIGIVAILLCLTFSSSVFLYAQYWWEAGGGRLPSALSFERRQLAAAAEWASDHSGPDDIFLGQSRTGNYLAGFVRGRVFTGHSVATLHERQKSQQVEQFFSSDTVDAWRDQLIRDYAITYIVYGPYERSLGAWDGSDAAILVLVFAQGDVLVYRVAVSEPDRSTTKRP